MQLFTVLFYNQILILFTYMSSDVNQFQYDAHLLLVKWVAERTIEQTTRTMPLAPKTVAAATLEDQ